MKDRDAWKWQGQSYQPGGGYGQGGYGAYGGGLPAGDGSASISEGAPMPGADALAAERAPWQREVLTAGEIATPDVKAVGGGASLRQVAALMSEESCGIVPVVDEARRLIGVVTDRDLVVRAGARGLSFDETPASAVMSRAIVTVSPDDEIDAVIALMGAHQVRRLPVVDWDRRLLGIIALADVVNRADHDDEVQTALQRISARRPPR